MKAWPRERGQGGLEPHAMAGKLCATTVLQWVEQLLEQSVNEEMMTEAAQVFSPSHYADVVDERNISHLCGYPLCSKPLGPQPQQKYHISLAQKKVFDLTQRKKFCSVECYRASNYYASQLSSLPSSARSGITVVMQFLPHASHSKTEQFKTSDVLKKPPIASPVVGSDSRVQIKEVPTEEATTSKLSELRLKEDEHSGDIGLEDSVHLEFPKLSSVGHLLHAMSSWCTPDTWHLVEQMKQQTHIHGDSVQQVDRTASDNEEFLLASLGNSSDSPKGEGLSQEAEQRGVTQSKEESRESVKVIPPVHSSAHSQLQRTIFVQQLRRNVLSVSTDLGLHADEVLPRVLPLVWTFRFSRHTVMFKPGEWKLIILVLVQVVAPEWNIVTQPLSGTIQEWLRAVNATATDLNLMLNSFTHTTP